MSAAPTWLRRLFRRPRPVDEEVRLTLRLPEPGQPGNRFPLGVVPIKPLVDEVVVERLERLLARAKAGQIQFIAYAVEMRNGSFATNWAGQGRRTNLETASMIAQLEFEFRLGIANSDEVPFDPLPPAS